MYALCTGGRLYIVIGAGIQGRCLLIKFHVERPPRAEIVSNHNSKVLRPFPARCLYTITKHHGKDKHLVSHEKVCWGHHAMKARKVRMDVSGKMCFEDVSAWIWPKFAHGACQAQPIWPSWGGHWCLHRPWTPILIKSGLARSEGGGDKIEDLMELRWNLPHVSKNTLFSNKLALVVPQMVFVYHYEASR